MMEDSDFDGMADVYELYAGFDPLDSNSCFRMTVNVDTGASHVAEVEWTSVTGKTYSISILTSIESIT